MSPGTLISNDEFEESGHNQYNIYGLGKGKRKSKTQKLNT